GRSRPGRLPDRRAPAVAGRLLPRLAGRLGLLGRRGPRLARPLPAPPYDARRLGHRAAPHHGGGDAHPARAPPPRPAPAPRHAEPLRLGAAGGEERPAAAAQRALPERAVLRAPPGPLLRR